MLFLISQKYNKKDFGICWGGRLRMMKKIKVDQKKKNKGKNTKKILKENKLDIVIQCNMKIANYSDVTVNLNYLNYKFCLKNENEILYIHKNWNYPSSICKQIPTID